MSDQHRFEDKIDILNNLLSRHRSKWQLDAITWMDYDDVCQIIRIHVFNKWHMWDQERPFENWAATVIMNQTRNIIRNHYSNYARPCLKCEHNLGGDSCALTPTGVQDENCPLMAKWKKKKERAYNIKLPLPMEEGVCFGKTSQSDHFDYEKSEQRLHKAVMKRLGEKHKMIYKMIYVDKIDENEVAEHFGFKKDPSKRNKARYKQISNLKKKFSKIAEEEIKKHDII